MLKREPFCTRCYNIEMLTGRSLTVLNLQLNRVGMKTDTSQAPPSSPTLHHHSPETECECVEVHVCKDAARLSPSGRCQKGQLIWEVSLGNVRRGLARGARRKRQYRLPYPTSCYSGQQCLTPGGNLESGGKLLHSSRETQEV